MKKLSSILFALAALLACARAFAQVPPATVVGPPPNVMSWDFSVSDVAKYGVTGFKIERKTELCATTPQVAPWVALATVAPTLRTYTDATAVAGTSSCYRLSAVNPTATTISGQADKTDSWPAPPAATNFKVTLNVNFNPATGKYELTIAQMDSQ